MIALNPFELVLNMYNSLPGTITNLKHLQPRCYSADFIDDYQNFLLIGFSFRYDICKYDLAQKACK